MSSDDEEYEQLTAAQVLIRSVLICVMAQNLLLFYKFQVNFQETFIISVILYIVIN